MCVAKFSIFRHILRGRSRFKKGVLQQGRRRNGTIISGYRCLLAVRLETTLQLYLHMAGKKNIDKRQDSRGMHERSNLHACPTPALLTRRNDGSGGYASQWALSETAGTSWPSRPSTPMTGGAYTKRGL